MADTKVSALAAASSALAADEVPVNEAGTSKKLTIAQVRDFLFANLGAFSPGSFSVPTGYYVEMTSHLVLTSTQRATLAGTARAYIHG